MVKDPTKMTPEEQHAILQYLKAMPKPKPAPMRKSVRDYFFETVLPPLKDDALSQLWRMDQVLPRLVSFMEDKSLGIVDVSAAVGGDWGDARSKDATARVHQFSVRIPGVMFSTLVSEVWFLHREGKEATDEAMERARTTGISNDPDRREGVMFNTLHLDTRTMELMQLVHTIEIIKVLGVNRSRKSWRDTKWGDITFTVDPMAAESGERMVGRFIASDPENDNSELKS